MLNKTILNTPETIRFCHYLSETSEATIWTVKAVASYFTKVGDIYHF